MPVQPHQYVIKINSLCVALLVLCFSMNTFCPCYTGAKVKVSLR